jgi:hypothetical protein
MNPSLDIQNEVYQVHFWHSASAMKNLSDYSDEEN